MSPTGTLSTRFQATCRAAGATGDTASLADALLRGWAGPQRHYHDITHLRACLAALDAHAELAERSLEVELGLYFHDAVYEPTRHDNEERSALWAEQALTAAGLPAPSVARIAAMVRATALSAAPATADEALLVDLDRSILAAAPDVFDAYERGVRAEYPEVPEPVFREGRRAVLKALLAAPLFHTEALSERWDGPARDNLRRSLEKLERGDQSPPGEGPGKP